MKGTLRGAVCVPAPYRNNEHVGEITNRYVTPLFVMRRHNLHYSDDWRDIAESTGETSHNEVTTLSTTVSQTSGYTCDTRTSIHYRSM